MTEELITVSQAAQLKGVSRSVVYKAIERGDLKVEIILNRQGLKRDEVTAWEPRKAGRRKGTPATDETKARIGATQKLRWANRRRDP